MSLDFLRRLLREDFEDNRDRLETFHRVVLGANPSERLLALKAQFGINWDRNFKKKRRSEIYFNNPNNKDSFLMSVGLSALRTIKQDIWKLQETDDFDKSDVELMVDLIDRIIMEDPANEDKKWGTPISEDAMFIVGFDTKRNTMYFDIQPS